MSLLPQYRRIVRSGSLIRITGALEGETELVPGTKVWVAGVDDAGSVNVILDRGYGEWRSFDPEDFEWVIEDLEPIKNEQLGMFA